MTAKDHAARIHLGHPGRCVKCGAELGEGSEAFFSRWYGAWCVAHGDLLRTAPESLSRRDWGRNTSPPPPSVPDARTAPPEKPGGFTSGYVPPSPVPPAPSSVAAGTVAEVSARVGGDRPAPFGTDGGEVWITAEEETNLDDAGIITGRRLVVRYALEVSRADVRDWEARIREEVDLAVGQWVASVRDLYDMEASSPWKPKKKEGES